ncbi:porin family protein [Ochrovirga pacifica]|uniref:porin family protein n=1 Tax=Ochrovirga pacifica TaxID=1042376 RepID=UPI000255A53D|nr:porin family protein [Ochrovirga pacifica]
MKFKMLLIVALCTTFAFAQEEKESYFGIKAGYNLASLRDGDVDHRNGFHVGIYGEHQLNKHVSFQPEIQYSQLGFKNGNNQTIKLDYIQVPLIFKGYIVKPLYVELGPQVGVNISKKEETDLIFGTTTETTEPNTIDWGMNAGVGVSVNPGITLGLRYYHGIGSAYEDTDVYNSLYQVFVGINL